MPPAKEDKMLEKLIKIFVYKTKGKITKIQLFKFLYLADLYAVKCTGKQLTNVDWRYYRYGPWTQEIEDALQEMNGREIILENRGKACLIRVGPGGNQSENLDLPKNLVFMLENIRREWAGVEKDNIDKLLKYVYSTAPMVDIIQQKHEPEEMATLNLRKEREMLLRK